MEYVECPQDMYCVALACMIAWVLSLQPVQHCLFPLYLFFLLNCHVRIGGWQPVSLMQRPYFFGAAKDVLIDAD